MIPQYELKAEDIRAYTLNLLKDHVKLDVAGYVCTTEVIFDVLLKASAEIGSSGGADRPGVRRAGGLAGVPAPAVSVFDRRFGDGRHRGGDPVPLVCAGVVGVLAQPDPSALGNDGR